MTDYDVDTSDPGKAARVVWAAAVLFAKVSGMNAENAGRKSNGYAMAYDDLSYAGVVEEALAGLRGGAA